MKMIVKVLSLRHLLAMLLLVTAIISLPSFYVQPLQAAELGRLFTTPAERQLLDRRRRENRPMLDITAKNSPGSKAKTMVYNGIVTRGNGDRQIWINGKPVNGRKGPEGIHVYRGPDHDHRVTLTVPGKHKVVKVKPGQRWNLASGKVDDFRDTTSSSAASTASTASAVDTAKP